MTGGAGGLEILTFLFTDVVGSTRLWETEPEAMSRSLARHDRLLGSCIESCGGHVFKTVGDAFCAVFVDASDAVQAAVRAQLTLGVESWPGQATLRVRMGLHSGSCEERDDDYFGPTVNRAARLQAVAHGGQVVLSGATAELVTDSLPDGISLKDLGRHQLKDLTVPERVFQLEGDGLSGPFPPLRSIDNPETGNNLPAQLTSFVGRSRQLSEIAALRAKSRLVTLTGVGGCGKTRLALEVVADLEGVWFVDLASVEETQHVGSAIASALQVRQQAGRPIAETLTEALSDRRVTILLDNCEHLIGACAELAHRLLRSCPGVQILATSREPLGIEGEFVYRVPPLSVPPDDNEVDFQMACEYEAAQLFIERATASQAGFEVNRDNATSVISICRRLDGIPLALELAAARVKTLSLAGLEANLNDRFRLLTKGRRTSPPRHQTLRALVQWSVDLLSDPERAALRRLSVFSGSFTLEAVEVVLADDGTDSSEPVDLLESLVEKNLVQLVDDGNRPVRYRLLETIRQFGAEELAAHGEEPRVRSSHANAFLSLVEAAAPHLWKSQRLEWLARLDADRDNLNAAIGHVLSDPTTGQLAMRFVVAMSAYWEMSSQTTRALDIGRALLAHPAAKVHDRLWVKAMAALALVWRGDNWELAMFEPDVLQAVEVARHFQMDQELVVMLVALSGHRWRRGEFEAGRNLVDQAVDAARNSGDPMTLGFALIGSSVTYGGTSHPGEGRARLVEAQACLRTAGDTYWQSMVLNNLSCADINEGDLRSARHNIYQGLDLAQPGGNDVVQTLLVNLGEVELTEGNVAAARDAYAEAIAIQLRIGCMNHVSGPAVAGLARCASALSDSNQAAYLHGAARSVIDRSGLQEDDADINEDVERLKRDMETSTFETAFTRGLALSPRESLRTALQWAQDQLTLPPTAGHGLLRAPGGRWRTRPNRAPREPAGS
jgi:predicted ATPase/class 3 adenylate cyclase